MVNLHVDDVVKLERDKYEEMCECPDYHNFSPGMENFDRFMEVIQPEHGESLVDIGCGPGRAGLAFQERGLQVTWVDLTDMALDPGVDRKKFIQSSIWDQKWTKRQPPMGWTYGYCTDVMEHIPTEFTMLAIERIVHACRTTWFQIAFDPESYGSYINQPLHLTVQPFEWWRDRIATIGHLVDARDICRRGVFVDSNSSLPLSRGQFIVTR